MPLSPERRALLDAVSIGGSITEADLRQLVAPLISDRRCMSRWNTIDRDRAKRSRVSSSARIRQGRKIITTVLIANLTKGARPQFVWVNLPNGDRALERVR